MSDGVLAPVWNISRAKDSSTLFLAQCEMPNIFLSKKYLASRQWLHKASPLTVGNQFPRLSHENKYPIFSSYINGNLRWLHHTGATYSKHERIQHRQIPKLATNLNILRASFKAEFQASQLSDQNDICQSLIFSGHRDNKLWGLGTCQVEDSSPNLTVGKNPFALLKKPS